MNNHQENMVPLPLAEAIKVGRVVLFLGAGASMETQSEDGKRPPSANELAITLSTRFLGEDLSDFGLMQVAEMASRVSGQHAVFDYIRSVLKSFPPSEAHKLLPSFRWHTIATTNYDTLVESAYGICQDPVQNLIPFVKDSEPIETKRSEVQNPLIYLKLHGCVDHAHDSDIPLILDPSHYEQYRTNRARLFDRLTDYAHEIPFLFVGYGLTDPHIQNLVYRLDRTGIRPEYYVVTPNIPAPIQQHWLSRRIVAIEATFGKFMAHLNDSIPELRRRIQTTSRSIELPLTKYFRTHTDPSEFLLKRLENDLLHVHPTMPVEQRPARNFYRGYDFGFSSVAYDLDARRKVANDLILQLIDDQHSTDVRFYLLRGAAGTGKTVALKRIAWEIAPLLNAPVFWCQEKGRLRHEAIQELHDLTGDRLYLVLDRAIERLEEIEETMRVALAHEIPLTIVSAERDSTWNVEKENFDSRWEIHSFGIGQLVRQEIEELIEQLKRHGALGVLAPLTRTEQVKAFEEADRHLLVALHEVTHGKPFEDIVIDECHSLTPSAAQQLYLDICTLNQFEAPVRAGVINRISGISFNQYKREFFSPLEGVVLAQHSPYSGDYEYRSRHARVASLVFKQAFPTDVERVEQVERLVSCLDEGYNADRDALTSLIRARNLVTLLTDVSQGRRVYRSIGELLGDRWYVRHQHAIFELIHRHGSLVAAEEEARKALEMEPRRTSVLHTLAEVSRARAQREPDGHRKNIFRQQARERLGKISRDRSSYADGSRCKLRLDEMRDALGVVDEGDAESAVTFAERTRLARQAIDGAVDRHPTDPEITRLDAVFFDLLKENERARLALERAWRQNPKGPNVGLQLVRIYQDLGDFDKARATLEQALERHPQNPRVNFEMAVNCVQSHSDIERAAYHFGRAYHSGDRK